MHHDPDKVKKVFDQAVSDVTAGSVFIEPKQELPLTMASVMQKAPRVASVFDYSRYQKRLQECGSSLALQDPMLQGYCIGELPRRMLSAVLETSDIVTVAQELDAKHIYIAQATASALDVRVSLMRNGFGVSYARHDGNLTRSYLPSSRNLLVILEPNEEVYCSDYLRQNLKRRLASCYLAMMTGRRLKFPSFDHVMMRIKISPTLQYAMDYASIYYHIDAAAGEAYVVYPAVARRENPTFDSVIQRAYEAQICKTWFPVTRERFIDFDERSYPRRHCLFETGVVVRLTTSTTPLFVNGDIGRYDECDMVRDGLEPDKSDLESEREECVSGCVVGVAND